jgi:hypothetical protein
LIDPDLLRADAFETFMADRQRRLLALIEQATGKPAYSGPAEEEGVEAEDDEDALEAGLTMAGAAASDCGSPMWACERCLRYRERIFRRRNGFVSTGL